MPDKATPDDLAITAEAWLLTSDPAARHRILALLEQVAATGADPIVQLRDGMDRWFGKRAPALRSPAALPSRTGLVREGTGAVLPLEPLVTLRRPTLWPQRPKRLPDELFSSWLWRAAVAANVPPRVFAKQVLASDEGDVDRDIGEANLRRLAQVTGQTSGHLAGGLLRRVPGATYDAQSGLIENVILSDERFLLGRGGQDLWGRPNAVLQYCPACLASDGRPYFRRSWRLAHVATCLEHGCRLHDRCWQCDKPVALLAQKSIDPVPRCQFCAASLAQASWSPSHAHPRQAALHEVLLYLAIHIPPNKQSSHLDVLHRQFGPVVRARVADREVVLQNLSPPLMVQWFGVVDDSRHAERLQMLAEGVRYAGLASALQRRRRRCKRPQWKRTLGAKRRADRAGANLDEGARRGLPSYSETARTLMWTMIKGQRERTQASTRQGVQSADQNR